jgi:hypothetical protein
MDLVYLALAAAFVALTGLAAIALDRLARRGAQR